MPSISWLQHLAPTSASVLAILGSGVQARSHVQAIREVMNVSQVGWRMAGGWGGTGAVGGWGGWGGGEWVGGEGVGCYREVVLVGPC